MLGRRLPRQSPGGFRLCYLGWKQSKTLLRAGYHRDQAALLLFGWPQILVWFRTPANLAGPPRTAKTQRRDDRGILGGGCKELTGNVVRRHFPASAGSSIDRQTGQPAIGLLLHVRRA